MGFFLSKTWLWWLLAAVLAAVIAWLICRWRMNKTSAALGAGAAAAGGLAVAATGKGADSGHAAELAARDSELKVLRQRLADCEKKGAALQGQVKTLQGEVDQHKGAAANFAAKQETANEEAVDPAPDVAAGAAVLGFPLKLDDLKVVEGIGPKIESLLHEGGITTWRQLADAPVSRLQEILTAAGSRYQVHNPATWPRQASMLLKGEWDAFKTWTDELTAGRE